MQGIAVNSDSDSRPVTRRAEPIANETELTAFQGFLDDQFPIGAMCAVISTKDGRLDATSPVATGRLLCSAVNRDESGQWWHELVIDPRGSVDGEVEPLSLWVSAPRRHEGIGRLWECEVRMNGTASCSLRLNADPPEPWRPTLQMREAVTKAYAEHWPAPVMSP